MAQEKAGTVPRIRPGGIHVISQPVRPAQRSIAVADISPTYRRVKRALDVAVSLTALILLSPVLFVVAVLICATSSGPALYRQRRVGRGGRMFTMYKFRSMHQNADHSLHRQAYTHFVRGNVGTGKVDRASLAAVAPDQHARWSTPATSSVNPMQKGWLRLRQALTPEDPRITPIGALIRRTSIDELPQLINVLRGDMSLVGPRPPIPYEVRLYSPRHLRRLAVTPGLTGIWQIYGRGRVPFEHMVEMDLHYIENRSFWLDLRLLVLTLPTVVFAHGAK